MHAEERLRLGQWFTPPAVADLALALAAHDAAPGARVLDPACGDGAFLARAGLGALGSLVGVEIDAAAAAAARLAAPTARVLREDLFAPGSEVDGLAPFDVVVGNPPYVRQERLDRAAKARVAARLAGDLPGVSAAQWASVLGRGDLAAACILRALALTRPGGRVALVVSSALLDASYARALWDLVGSLARVTHLIDAPEERWFPDAAVNAIICVLQRRDRSPADDPPVQIARLRVPTSEAARRVRGPHDLAAVAEVREASAAEPGLWAGALRAEPAWFDFAAHAGERLVPLGEIAEVRRGLTSGANDIFYLSRARAAELALPTEYLLPLLRSPRSPTAACIAVEPAAAQDLVLACPPRAEILDRHPPLRAYLEAHAGAAERPSLRTRSPWWHVRVRPARVFLTKAYAARFVQRLAATPMVADQRVYAVFPRAGIEPEVLAAVLNSTYAALALESLGRASMGEGALEWTVADAARLPIVDPRCVASGPARAALTALARRPIAPVDGERGRADRAALDRAVLQVPPALATAVHDALCSSVARRQRRAGGHSTRRARSAATASHTAPMPSIQTSPVHPAAPLAEVSGDSSRT